MRSGAGDVAPPLRMVLRGWEVVLGMVGERPRVMAGAEIGGEGAGDARLGGLGNDVFDVIGI